ncbi:MAG TPA: zf-HC2 domain-containing protein [Candidatus Saccharimonadales bacterium]|nr:zf-HC2 domain-containing protein [Candidatus Saccharimonadales bacterium]
MLGETKPGTQCAEFDALLTEAIDGTLNGQRRERFDQHKAGCPACSTLFAEVVSGVAWLNEVEDVEPPPNLIHNILAATSGVAQQAAKAEPRRTAWERFLVQTRIVFAPVLTPRFGMSMGMAFFSITLVLNMAQVRIRDLTPHNLSHTFYSSQNKLMKYYENMRLVYEIESRVRDLRNASDESEREQKNRRREKNSNQTQEQNQNSEPDPRPHREFSRGQNVQYVASLNGSEPCLMTHSGLLAKPRREI